MTGALGRNKPTDWNHVLTHPLSAVTIKGFVPVVLGINWYEGFDTPEKGQDGRERIRISGNVRGGHCICVEPALPLDRPQWHIFYDQGSEGACEGFGHSRALSLMTGWTFDAFWLYDDARRAEGTYPEGEGSTNRSACDALRKWGDHYESGPNCVREEWRANRPGTGIKTYHWATHANEVLAALGLPAATEIALLNSWGTAYPQRVYLPVEDLQTLLTQEGEASVLVR